MRTIDANYVLDALGIFSDCEHGDTHFLNGIETAREIVEQAPTVGRWISVKDRLPDTYKRVITYDKYSGTKENWLLKSKPCVSWSTGFHVTHWMPMPEPPREENDETD